MLRSLVSATALTLMLVGSGCANSAQPPQAPSGAPATAAAQPAPTGGSAPSRQVGDFFVHRFSGSFAAEPLTLSEEVTAREGAVWVVDFALNQSERVERLRVRFDAQSGQAVSAARLNGSAESKATLGDYEALMARTVFAADVNDGLVSESAQTCLVGSDALDCQTKTYKVWVGESAATLAVVHASKFADRDVSGELTTDDGKLVYRAELVEARQGKPTTGLASR
jgi:hypothetical protein